MWTLKITLRPYAEQQEIDPEYEMDEASLIISHLIQYWGMLPEDMLEMATWSETSVEVREIEVIDTLVDPMNWIMVNTSPLKIELVRDE
jgi:hypothetical protein